MRPQRTSSLPAHRNNPLIKVGEGTDRPQNPRTIKARLVVFFNWPRG